MKYSFLLSSIIFSIFYSLISPSSKGQTPDWLTITSPTVNTLYGVSHTDRNTWVAVGGSGTIIRSTDAGLSWAQISSPAADDLRSVSFKDSLGIAVGISGRILRSTDSGLSWTLEQRITTKNLFAVSMGKNSTVIGGHEGTILYSTDGGVTWAPRTAGTASEIFGLSVLDTVAVGACGQGAIIMSTNAGNAWGLTVLGNNLTFFMGVSFANNKTGWMVGTSSTISSIIIRSDLSGFVWNAQTSPVPDALNGVCFVNIDSGTAVGANGTIIHTINGGSDWQEQISGVNKNLNALSLLDSIGIAVGDSGIILRTVNSAAVDVHEKILLQKPGSYYLGQNYPNPFNPATIINYTLPGYGLVIIKVYNVLGKEITTLVNEEKAAGNYSVKFDGSSLSSGIYFYKMQTNHFTATKKFIIVK